ncbi:MAG: ABC transporter ATP-binding protein [Myxococcota bacterium]
MIRVDRLWKAYDGRPVLQGLSLSAEAGSRTALVGPNGSGKTTLLRCLLGLVSYDGTITIGGHDPVRDHVAAQRRVAYVPQRAPALPVPVGELVAFWATQRDASQEALFRWTQALGLDVAAVWRNRFPSLSGGMQQKLLAAMALASDCTVMLLDEPTANLDPPARAVFFDALAHRQPRPTVVLSSHRLEELRGLVDRVVVLDEGRVTFDDALDRFLDRPDASAALDSPSTLPFRRSP